jgi:aminopeptidase N
MYTSPTPQIKYRKDYKPSNFQILETDLIIELEATSLRVTSVLQIAKNLQSATGTSKNDLTLDGTDLDLHGVWLDNEQLTSEKLIKTENTLTIKDVPNEFTLTIKTETNPSENTSLKGIFKSGSTLCSQCEADGFKRITYYLDRPDNLSEFCVNIIANKTEFPVLLSNGNMVEKGDFDDGRHYVKWHDPHVKPSYLFALVAGKFDCISDFFVTKSGIEVSLKIYMAEGKALLAKFALECLKKAMRWDEERFGFEYDLDNYMIVALDDFNLGGMENKGLNIFNSAFVLADEKIAMDSDFDNIEKTIAHEYFHNWTGNRVTLRDWFQLSLKEGLTVFREQLFCQSMHSYAVTRIEQVNLIRAVQFAEDTSPLVHPVRPDSYIEMSNFYTSTVYNKGAEVVRMLHTLLGEAGFQKGMQLYTSRHDGAAVTCHDFVKAMEDANSCDLSQFDLWYSQAGTPEVAVTIEKISTEKLKISFTQSCPDTKEQSNKFPFMLPIKLGFLSREGKPLKFSHSSEVSFCREDLLVLTEKQQSFELDIEETDCIPSLCRGFSAPVKLEYPYTKEELAILFANDPDEFNRWDSGQKLFTSMLIGEEASLDAADLNMIGRALSNMLKDESLEPSFKAFAVNLPNLNGLIGSTDTDSLFTKYRLLKKFIATSMESLWLDIYNNINCSTVGERWLRNTALSNLMSANAERYAGAAIEQQQHATKMSNELSAMRSIAWSSYSDKQRYTSHFYQKWQNEDSVLDKWFSVLVTHDDEKTISIVRELLEHPKFSFQNLNRVGAVIGAFSAANPMQFHHKSGAGYELLANVIIKLDKTNPPFASMIMRQFGMFMHMDKTRSELMLAQFRRIKSTENLSAELLELIKAFLTNE